MRPERLDLVFYRGDTYAWRILLWTDEGKTQPADLTGVVAKSEIRTNPGGAVLSTVPCVITLPNQIDLSLTDWTGITSLTGVWDLQLTYSDQSVVTVVAGTVSITPDVTDSTVVSAAERRRAMVTA